MRTYEVLGSKNGAACFKPAVYLQEAQDYAMTLDHAAIYRSEHLRTGKKFHDATDKEFLYIHYFDPYWINKGIPSGVVQK